MPQVCPPAPGQPHVVIEADGENRISELDGALMVALYKRYGALLFRGFGLDTAQFGLLAKQFCTTSVVNESQGRQLVDAAANIQTVDGGVEAFSLHPELSREPWKPDLALFGCLKAPRRGGQTTICDGVALARALPAPLRSAMQSRRLLYAKASWPTLLEYWLGTLDPTDAQLAAPPPDCPYAFRRLPDGRVIRSFTRPFLHKPMFSDDLAFGNFLLFARFSRGRTDHPVLDDGRPVPAAWVQEVKAISDRLAVPIAWRVGDVLMLDNTRFLHGRTAITDPGERLILSYFGYLGFALADPEEPPNPIWRRENFSPPPRPGLRPPGASQVQSGGRAIVDVESPGT